MIGTSLNSIWMAAQARAQSKQITVPGGEFITLQPAQSISTMFGTLDGTVYPAFVLGQTDPDDTTPRLVL